MKIDEVRRWAVAITYLDSDRAFIDIRTMARTRTGAIRKHNHHWDGNWKYRKLRRKGQAKAVRVVLSAQEPDE